MSHFSVTVAVQPADGQTPEEAVGALLAPYDENLDVETYRDYETGAPSDHIAFAVVKQAAKDLANGTGILPYNPDGIGWSSAWSKDSPEVQVDKMRRTAALYDIVPAEPTWADIVDLVGRLWPDEAGQLLYDPDKDCAYTMSTANPDGKWDWWEIGGRWSGYFATPNADAYAASAQWTPRRDWNTRETFKAGSVNGGRRADLDFDAMRAAAAAQAEADYDLYDKTVAGTPEALSWPQVYDATKAKAQAVADRTGNRDEIGRIWDEARKSYNSQPRVQALKAIKRELGFMECLIDRFAQPRALFVEMARARAVPGYATVRADGKWMAKGEMGWWASSSHTPDSEIGYLEAANAYLETLPGDAYVFIVDCHT